MNAGAITINLRLAHHALSISGAYLRPIGSSISIGLIFIPEDAVPRYEYKKARTSQMYERPKAKEGMIDSRDSLSQRRDKIFNSSQKHCHNQAKRCAFCDGKFG